jgi:ABC-type bacteriocin/lantibiotic exporter with double-glycine peptidase domain
MTTTTTEHIQQARTMPTCGQACLAMLAGVSLTEACLAVGHRRGTKHHEIIKAARKLGLIPKTTLWQLAADHDALPANAILKQRRRGRKNWHWACVIDGVLHDPSMPTGGELGSNRITVSWMEFDQVTLSCRKSVAQDRF